jgi:hypothetical protein
MVAGLADFMKMLRESERSEREWVIAPALPELPPFLVLLRSAGDARDFQPRLPKLIALSVVLVLALALWGAIVAIVRTVI